MNSDGNHVFTGITQRQKESCHTYAIIFSFRFATIRARFGERTWCLSVETWDNSWGIWRPAHDPLRPKRFSIRTALVLCPPSSPYIMMSAGNLGEVPTLSGLVATLAIPEITVTR